MKKVTKEILQESAEKLMFNLSEEQLDKLLVEFDTIYQQMTIIGEIPGVDDAAPMAFPFDSYSTELREDVAGIPTDRDQLLKNAKENKDGQICLPKVIR